MKKFIMSFMAICILSLCSFAGNAGYVKGLGIVNGNDGKKYLAIRFSSDNVDFGCWSNITDRLWNVDPFYILWNTDDAVYSASVLSNLQKALLDHRITIVVTRGHGTSDITGIQVPLVENWYLANLNP